MTERQTSFLPDEDLGPLESTAVFSPCERYRYTLHRIWAAEPRILFVLLNPSHATDTKNDQTVNNCIAHARRAGFNHITICNLFAFRSPKPEVMREQDDPVGPDNDHHIALEHGLATTTVIGWGNHGAYRDRDLEVLRYLSDPLRCFGINKPSKKRPKGQPIHPCYLHGSRPRPLTIFRPYDCRESADV